MTALFDRCPACPRERPGLCFAQTRGRAFCWQYEAGDRRLERLLTGEVEPTPAGDSPPPVPAGPTFRRMRAAVVGRAALCRSCAVGCQQAKCHAGRGDEFGNAPIPHCFRCLTGRE